MRENLLAQITDIVYDAGKLIQDTEDIEIAKEKEGPANFVTKYDSMVQSYLMENFLKLIPDASFLCEEDGYSDTPVGDGYTFIIDPIDGTTNFICGFMCSAISVGLAFQHEMFLGVVYNPFRNEMFTAQKGKGAFLNGRQLSVADRALDKGVVNFGTTPYNPELRKEAFAIARRVSYHTMDLRELGTAAIGLCYIACNRVAAYASLRLSTWDYAAASIIVEEAGGVLSDFSGKPLDFSSKISVIGASPTGHKEFLSILSESL